jgi:hypothetical protein
VPVGVDAGGDQGVDVDHSAVLADLNGQSVGPDEGVRAGVERTLAECADLPVEVRSQLFRPASVTSF